MLTATERDAWRLRAGAAAFLEMRDLRDRHGVPAEIADAVCVAIKRQFDIIDELGSLAFGGDQAGAIAREMKRHYRREFDVAEIQRALDLAMAGEWFRRVR